MTKDFKYNGASQSFQRNIMSGGPILSQISIYYGFLTVCNGGDNVPKLWA